MKVKTITRTAVLLALTVVFQALGRMALTPAISNYVVGPLVNACLLISVATAGFFSGLTISLLAPIGAILTGASMPLALVPFIGIGNLIMVVMFYIFNPHRNDFQLKLTRGISGIVTGALMKFGFLFLAIRLLVSEGLLGEIPVKKADALIATFSFPQLITALVGGAIAILVIRALSHILANKKK